MSREECIHAMAKAIAQVSIYRYGLRPAAEAALDAAEPWIREREREAFAKGSENVIEAARDEDDAS